MFSKNHLPKTHSSPMRSGLKHDSLLWYDDLHQAQDNATISLELNESFACRDWKIDVKLYRYYRKENIFVGEENIEKKFVLWSLSNVIIESKECLP